MKGVDEPPCLLHIPRPAAQMAMGVTRARSLEGGQRRPGLLPRVGAFSEAKSWFPLPSNSSASVSARPRRTANGTSARGGVKGRRHFPFTPQATTPKPPTLSPLPPRLPKPPPRRRKDFSWPTTHLPKNEIASESPAPSAIAASKALFARS